MYMYRIGVIQQYLEVQFQLNVDIFHIFHSHRPKLSQLFGVQIPLVIPKRATSTAPPKEQSSKLMMAGEYIGLY